MTTPRFLPSDLESKDHWYYGLNEDRRFFTIHFNGQQVDIPVRHIPMVMQMLTNAQESLAYKSGFAEKSEGESLEDP